MLVLSRKLGERIVIGDRIVVTVVKLDHGQVRLGIEAPREIAVFRAEGDCGLPRGDRSSLPPPPLGATDRLRGIPSDGAGPYTQDRAGGPDGTEACSRSERGTAPRSWVRAPAIAYEEESHPQDETMRDVGLVPNLPNSDPGGGRTMSDTHDPLRAGHRGDALRGLDWLLISGPISQDSALRIARLCFLGPAMDHGAGPACYRRRPEMARQTRRRTLVIQRHG